MKTNLLKIGKWWLLTAILAVALMAVSLSFCAWDDYSLKAVSANGKTGNYAEKPDRLYEIVTDNGTAGVADVGDVVQYGRFWQDENADGEAGLKPQRWIVVDIDANNVATLLAEKVVVFGNFWGNGTSYQNYYQSTLRAWLNSGRDSVTGSGTDWIIGNIGTENKRDDGIGSAFSGNESQVNKGFLDAAFDTAEKSILVPKNISGIKGFGKQNSPSTVHAYTTRNNNSSINDLVWIPSYSEIYGTTAAPSGLMDGSPSTQFEYYEKNPNNLLKVAGATAYARNAGTTSYYNNGGGSANGDAGATWWWLRSPHPSISTHALSVHGSGVYSNGITYNSGGGVRPAVCVQL